MNRRRILHAIRFPALLLIWTAAVVVVTLQVDEAGGLPEPSATAPAQPARQTLGALPAAPDLADPAAWSTAVAQLARHSEVLNGSWQPPARTVPRIHPVATVVPARLPGAAPTTPAAGELADVRGADEAPAVVVAPAVSVEPSQAIAPVAADARVVKTPVARFARFGSDKSRARDALRDGRFSEAYALLRPRVSDARHDSEYLGLLALAAMRLGGHGEAMVLYQRLAALEPASSRWRMGLALAQEGLGLDPSSEYRLALALADDTDGVRALLAGRLADADLT